MGWEGWNVAQIQPGKRHQELRGLLLKGLSPSMVVSYDPLVEKVIENQLLYPLARSGPGGSDPAVFIEEWVFLIPLCSLWVSVSLLSYSAVASILTDIAYGDSLTEEQRKELLHANQVAVRAAFKINKTTLLLDIFPTCRSRETLP
jgi:hypothetical protein